MKIKKWDLVAIALSLLAFIFYGVLITNSKGTGDELLTLKMLKSSGNLFGLSKVIMKDTHPPLHLLLMSALTSLFGIKLSVLKICSALFGSIGVFFTYQLAKDNFNLKIAFISLLYSALSLASLNYFTMGRVYSLLHALSALLLWQFFQLLDHDKKGTKPSNNFLFQYGLVVILLGYAHYFGLLLATLLFIFGNYLFSDKELRNAFNFIHLKALILLAPLIPVIFYQYQFNRELVSHITPVTKAGLQDFFQYMMSGSSLWQNQLHLFFRLLPLSLLSMLMGKMELHFLPKPLSRKLPLALSILLLVFLLNGLFFHLSLINLGFYCLEYLGWSLLFYFIFLNIACNTRLSLVVLTMYLWRGIVLGFEFWPLLTTGIVIIFWITSQNKKWIEIEFLPENWPSKSSFLVLLFGLGILTTLFISWLIIPLFKIRYFLIVFPAFVVFYSLLFAASLKLLYQPAVDFFAKK